MFADKVTAARIQNFQQQEWETPFKFADSK